MIIADEPTSAAQGSAVEYNLSQILLRIPEGASPEQFDREVRACAEPALPVPVMATVTRLHKEGVLVSGAAAKPKLNEAVALAHMARELYGTHWIKLEVVGDEHTLQPDPWGTVEAAAQLIQDGFAVFPYCTDDLVSCQRLLDAGCEVLMPWGAPIGSGQGLLNPWALRTLRERLPDATLIVDAGIGTPSHAAQALEMGFDAVLLNSAVAQARDPSATRCAPGAWPSRLG